MFMVSGNMFITLSI